VSRTPHYPQIAPRAWEHPADAAALAALRRLPGFDQVVQQTFGRLNEWTMHRTLLSNARQASLKTDPRLWRLYSGVLHTFDVDEPWPLWVRPMDAVNAGAIGMNAPYMFITDAAVRLLSDDSLRVILAHEIGHVLSGHVLYKTMARAGLSLGFLSMSAPPATPVFVAVLAALMRWDRISELSADRASALALGSEQPVVHTLNLVGEEHREALKIDPRLPRAPQLVARKLLETVHGMTRRHPPIPERVEQLRAWGASAEFAACLQGGHPRRDADAPPSGDLFRAGLEESTRSARDWATQAGTRLADGAGAAMRWLRDAGESS